MELSLLGLDYITGYPVYEPLSSGIRPRMGALIQEAAHRPGDYTGLYYRPDSIIKSSVGEFYDENMKFFFETITDLYQPLVDLSKGSNKHPDIPSVLQALSSLVPLGAIGYRVNVDWCPNSVSKETYLQGGLYHPLREICKFIGMYYAHRIQGNEFHKERIGSMDKIAHALCAGYTPQEVGDVTRLVQDSGFISEYIIANMLYPWVTQPMGQLRMLVPSLPSDTVQHIMQIYLKRANKFTKLSAALDVGYTYTYDIVSDFHTYSIFKDIQLENPFSLRKQFRTPFMLFDLPSLLMQLEDGLKKRVDECVQRSKRLYMEIIKTGLRYESQYAVLGGYRGRFCISCNLGTLVEMIDVLSPPGVSVAKVDRITEHIKKDVLSTTRLAEEGGLFE